MKTILFSILLSLSFSVHAAEVTTCPDALIKASIEGQQGPSISMDDAIKLCKEKINVDCVTKLRYASFEGDHGFSMTIQDTVAACQIPKLDMGCVAGLRNAAFKPGTGYTMTMKDAISSCH